jgi:hypothetical protein
MPTPWIPFITLKSEQWTILYLMMLWIENKKIQMNQFIYSLLITPLLTS